MSRAAIFQGFAALAGLILTGAPHSIAASTPPPRPPAEEIPVRSFLAGRVSATAYVFAGSRFPLVAFDPPAAANQYLGRHTTNVSFYDQAGNLVTEAAAPGPYAAVVEFVPERGPSTRRLLTLYHSATEVPFAQRFDIGHLDSAARWSGLSPARLLRNGELLRAACQGQPLSSLAQNPGMARIFAGIARMPDGAAPLRKNDDSFACDRQWWVDLKRQFSGADKKWPASFVCPRKLDGPAAPTLREGTLAEAGMRPDAAEKIDTACEQWAADSDESFAVCIARHGVIVLHKAYGMRNGRPMMVTDRSWMASVTKCFSGACMMMLVDQGLVSLDDPVEKFVPELVGIPVRKPLTIRHLYTHTSGLAEWPLWADEEPDLEDQLAECYPYLKVGAKWEYGGQGNSVGCKILESITGEALPFFYLHHVLQPLGMDHTDVLGAHADMQTAPLDIARFAQMLLNRGRYGNLEFMKPETFDRMLPQKLTNVLGPDATKTFGISMDGPPGSGKFGHGAASSATFSIEAKDDLIVITCRNKAGKNWDQHHGKFMDAIHAGIADGEPKTE